MADNNETKVSIIIPIYNVEHYLEECLSSVISQDMTDYEVICINDASTDNSAEILSRFGRQYDSITIVNHKYNQGLSIARNHGLEIAKGEYILFLDSDDFLGKGTLKDIYNIAKNNNVDILGFEYQKFDSDSGENIHDHQKSRYYLYNDIITGKKYFEDMIIDRELVVMVWQYMFSLDFIKKNGIKFQPGIKHEDYLFTFESLMKAKRVMAVTDICYYYRLRTNSITDKMDYMRAHSIYYTLTKIDEYRKDIASTDSRFEYALDKFIVYLASNLKNKIERLSDEDKRIAYELGTEMDTLKYQSFMNDYELYRYICFDNVSLSKIKNAKTIYIYGAGLIGSELERFLSEMGICVSLFLVSKKDKTNWKNEGGKVVTLGKGIPFDDDTLVIVAALPRAQEDMIRNLRGLGIKNYIHV